MNARIYRGETGHIWIAVGKSNNIFNLDDLRLMFNSADYSRICGMVPGETLILAVRCFLWTEENRPILSLPSLIGWNSKRCEP